MMLTVLLALTCGTQLWSKKILTDPGAATALAPAPINGTIAQLGGFPRTHKRQSYIVDGTIIEVRPEADSDIHVVLEDAQGNHLVAEFPHAGCAVGSPALAAIKRARKQAALLQVGQHVRVTGMLFFDKPHAMIGNAPNYAELHPLFKAEALP